jgi:pterin-4a-carbinolamine dehydratase
MIKTKRISYLVLKNWELKDEKIIKKFQFTSLKKLLILLIKLQKFIMEPLIINHNNKNWKTVKISLKSLDVNAITEYDFKLADKIEKSFKST